MKNEIQRAIYVGKPLTSINGHQLRYGRTGGYLDLGGFLGPTFKPDGSLHAEAVCRLDVYIPAVDMRRHCPSWFPPTNQQPKPSTRTNKMQKYVIAASLRAMQRTEGTEIMASSLTEALDKYEVMGGACVPRGDGTGATWTRLPYGTEQETFIECLNEIAFPWGDGDFELEPEGAAS